MLSPHRGLAPRVSIIPHLKKPCRERAGHRFCCTIVLFVYASRSDLPSKKPMIPRWSYVPLYDGLIAQENKHFAEGDIGAASRAYYGREYWDKESA